MLPSTQVLSRLLALLYDAAADPKLWEVFLLDFTRLSRGNSAALMMHDFRNNRHNVSEQFGLDPDVLRMTYNARSEIRDMWAEKARSVSRVGWVGTSEQLTSDHELMKSDFYHECLWQLKIAHGVFGVVEQYGPIIANFSLYRSTRGNSFGQSEVELVKFFVPHLRRAIQLHLRLSDLQCRSASLESALDMVSSGIVLFDATGRVIFANGVAREVLKLGDGLVLVRDRLKAGRPDESVRLHEVIRTATTASIGSGTACGGAVVISRKVRPPLRVLVTPIRNLKIGRPHSTTGIAFIVDQEQRTRSENEILQVLFDLTPAECRVALLLGNGKSVSEVSANLHVSTNTLKSQIANIYAKTGASRQSQLVRLLMQLPQTHASEPQK